MQCQRARTRFESIRRIPRPCASTTESSVPSSLPAAASPCSPAAPIASKTQESVIEDPARLLSLDITTQTAALDEIAGARGEILKVPVLWRSIAPDGTSDGQAGRRPDGSEQLPGRYLGRARPRRRGRAGSRHEGLADDHRARTALGSRQGDARRLRRLRAQRRGLRRVRHGRRPSATRA